MIRQVALLDPSSKKRPYFWITPALHQAITECLAQRKQAVIFINRRGYSFFMQCKECSHIFMCHQCSVSLTLHHNDTLVCHYCAYTIAKPSSCTKCTASSTSLLSKGLGTQYITEILKKLFPYAAIGRADKDVTVQRHAWKKTLDAFSQGELDILVGTQTITKGYHFPNVTLVGIIWADLNLSFPWYNAAETTLQQLIQVAGRAGRASQESTVIVQTMADHPIFNYTTEKNYLQFYKQEIENRLAVQYPPMVSFGEIELKHSDEHILSHEAQACAEFLRSIIERNELDISILGPAQSAVYKVKREFSKKIYLKGSDLQHIIKLSNRIVIKNYSSKIYWTPNPLS